MPREKPLFEGKCRKHMGHCTQIPSVCRACIREHAAELVVKNLTASNSVSPKLADEIECAKQWLLPKRTVTQIEIDNCISELNDIINQLRA